MAAALADFSAEVAKIPHPLAKVGALTIAGVAAAVTVAELFDANREQFARNLEAQKTASGQIDSALDIIRKTTALMEKNFESAKESKDSDKAEEKKDLTLIDTPTSNKDKFTKLKGNQGYKDKDGNIWKKDMKHKDHYDISDSKPKFPEKEGRKME